MRLHYVLTGRAPASRVHAQRRQYRVIQLDGRQRGCHFPRNSGPNAAVNNGDKTIVALGVALSVTAQQPSSIVEKGDTLVSAIMSSPLVTTWPSV